MAGTLAADNLQNGAGVSTSMDNAIYGSAKAWVNFNGNSGASPVVRASYNISSVTRTGVGQYTLAFTNALFDTNYSISGCASYDGTTGAQGRYISAPQGTMSTTQLQVISTNAYNGSQDCAFVFVQIFR